MPLPFSFDVNRILSIPIANVASSVSVEGNTILLISFPFSSITNTPVLKEIHTRPFRSVVMCDGYVSVSDKMLYLDTWAFLGSMRTTVLSRNKRVQINLIPFPRICNGAESKCPDNIRTGCDRETHLRSRPYITR